MADFRTCTFETLRGWRQCQKAGSAHRTMQQTHLKRDFGGQFWDNLSIKKRTTGLRGAK